MTTDDGKCKCPSLMDPKNPGTDRIVCRAEESHYERPDYRKNFKLPVQPILHDNLTWPQMPPCDGQSRDEVLCPFSFELDTKPLVGGVRLPDPQDPSMPDG